MRRRKNSKIMLGLLIAVVALGIGYAAITGVNLLINGSASIKSNGNFSVRFVRPIASETAIDNAQENAITISGYNADESAMNVSEMSASVTDDTHATFAVGALDEVGEYVDFTYTVVNESDEGIDASLSLEVADENDLADYFEITKSIGKNKITPDETTTVTVRVKLIGQPKVNDANGTFKVTLTATPVDESEESGNSGTGDVNVNKLIENVSLGDYVSLTPSYSGSYSCSTTGCSGSITPSELTLWRVISKNDDSSVDVVSENVSSTSITFSGINGYKYYITALQDIATKYENSTYTSGSRMMGYNGQTGTISGNLSPTNAGTSSTPSLSDSVGMEYKGGIQGDTLYAKDVNAVNNVLGTLLANKIGTNTASEYWIASRWYSYEETDHGWWLRYVDVKFGFEYKSAYYYNGGTKVYFTNNISAPIRPVLTLKSDLIVTNGDGKSASTAWELSEN